MENRKDMNWVDDRLSALGPDSDWLPNITHARARLEEYRTARKSRIRTWTWAGATAAATCAALLSFPASRAIAQRLWESHVLNRVETASVNLDALPVRWSLTGGYSEGVHDVAEAERKAGFSANLPAPGFLAGSPAISLIEPASAQVIIDAAGLAKALERVGAADLTVPNEWDGPSFGFQMGPVIEARYQNVTIKQCRPIILVTPPGFSMDRFAEIAFRIGGLDANQASSLAAKFAANPSWLIGVPRDAAESIEEVSLPSGPAILTEDSGELSLIWSTPGRVYEVSGKISRGLAITTANSIQQSR